MTGNSVAEQERINHLEKKDSMTQGKNFQLSPKIWPIGGRVVVLPDSIDDKLGSGVLVKAETTKTQDRRKQTRGTLVAVSGSSSFDAGDISPQVGDRVEFAMYSGQFYTENDIEYRIMNDVDIVGILRKE